MLLYLDTCIVIYLVEEHHVYCPVIETALADTIADLCFSPLVELECLVLPLRQNHTLLLDKYRRFFAVNHGWNAISASRTRPRCYRPSPRVSASFAVEHASEGKTGLHLALTSCYDAAVIDIMPPGLDGLAIIDELRQRRIKLPVIILSAKRSVDERVEGLEAGGDDYLTKPFSFSELLARIQALIRRANDTPEPIRITVGDLSIDLRTRVVTRADKKIALQPREFLLLEYLARNARRVVSKTMIMEHVWDYLSIEDTGIGISANESARIFERFYRCDRSRSKQGNGLGLSLALALVRTHGGDITVNSTPGQGSTFTVVLPRSHLGRGN